MIIEKAMSRKVTIQTIAEQAGMSKYAVSRALSGKSGVSEATRSRISMLAEQLGYERPSNRSLSAIAVLCEDEDLINGELNQKILTGLRNETHRIGYDLFELQTTGARQLTEVTSDVSGLILVGVNRPNIFDQVRASNLPHVKIGNFEPLEQSDIVRGTNYESGRVVGQMLLDLGHRHLVFVRGRRDFRGRQERFNGFFASAHAVPGAKVTDFRWDSPEGLEQQLTELLAGSIPATAFFCAHDGLAVTMVSELLTRGLRIPHDISIVGYGDYATAQHVRPALTTVSVPGQALGREAVRLLVQRIEEDDQPQYRVRVQIPSSIVNRESVGPAS